MTTERNTAQERPRHNSRTETRPPPPCPEHPDNETFTITQWKSGNDERAVLTQYHCGENCQHQFNWSYRGLKIPHRAGAGQCLDNEVLQDLDEATGQEKDDQKALFCLALCFTALMAAWLTMFLVFLATREILIASCAGAAVLAAALLILALKAAIARTKKAPDTP